MKKHVLVTGGAGYIGIHTCIELLQSGRDVIIVDNFSNSSRASVNAAEAIVGKSMVLIEADICNKDVLKEIFSTYEIDSVIHFAGLKAVGESVEKPLKYYGNNVAGSLVLLEVMSEFSVKKIVFSSSATVYGDSEVVPISEASALQPTNPYGHSKRMVEQILEDLYESDNEWSVVVLRYFNPIGAHSSGRIGEVPRGVPNNLMPYITQVAVGVMDELKVFGDDYPTRDGTGIRDYIHVTDLAEGHIKALNQLSTSQFLTLNLGTGVGYSVLEVVKAFEEASGKQISYQIVDRRPGDVGICYADAGLAQKFLGWKAKRDIFEMCEDAWRWQNLNPDGYDDA